MIPTKPVDVVLDCLLWVSGIAFVFSFLSPLLRVPQVAFVAGCIFAALLLQLALIARQMPEARPFFVYRILHLVAGAALGVLA